MSDRADRAIIITSCAAIAACSGFILLGNPGVVETEEGVVTMKDLTDWYIWSRMSTSLSSALQGTSRQTFYSCCRGTMLARLGAWFCPPAVALGTLYTIKAAAEWAAPNGLTGELRSVEEQRRTGRGKKVWVSHGLGQAFTLSVISSIVLVGCAWHWAMPKPQQRRW